MKETRSDSLRSFERWLLMTESGDYSDGTARGEQYLDDRTALGYAYDGEELVAKLFKEKAVRECQASTWLTVSLTPEGENRGLQTGTHRSDAE